MAYPLPRGSHYAAASYRYSRADRALCSSFGCASSGAADHDRRAAAKTPRKRAASGRLTGFIARRARREGTKVTFLAGDRFFSFSFFFFFFFLHRAIGRISALIARIGSNDTEDAIETAKRSAAGE